MRRENTNIVIKIKNGKYIALNKIEGICNAMNWTQNGMMEFINGGICCDNGR